MYYTPPPQCVSRFVRPPPSAPEPGPPYLDHYPPYHQDRVVNSQYGTQPQQYAPMYPPHYDSRRVYPAQSYPREEIFRESPIPIEIPPAAVPSYVPESRERYQQMEGYYPVAPHPTQIRPPYIRVCCFFFLLHRFNLIIACSDFFFLIRKLPLPLFSSFHNLGRLSLFVCFLFKLLKGRKFPPHSH